MTNLEWLFLAKERIQQELHNKKSNGEESFPAYKNLEDAVKFINLVMEEMFYESSNIRRQY